jgi:hypothetical protein
MPRSVTDDAAGSPARPANGAKRIASAGIQNAPMVFGNILISTPDDIRGRNWRLAVPDMAISKGV